VDIYRKFNEGKLSTGIVEDKFSFVAKFDEIKENEFNLNIPRYVDTFEEEEEVDIAKVQTEIEKLEGELKTVQAELNKYLKELGV
jgi:type I restriction enzyme M protein